MQAFTGLTTMYAGIGGLNTGNILTQLFFFIVLIILVRKFAWGPLINTMQKREEYVSNEIEAAEKSRAEAEQAQAEAAEQLKQTKQEAQQIIDDAKKAGSNQEQEIVEAARREADRIKESARAEIESEKEKALQTLQDKVGSLSVMIASKVIEKEISAEDQEELINQYIKEAGENDE